MKEFAMIKNEVRQDAEKRISDTAHYILYGYMPSWAAEHQTDSDRGLKQHSTATRWEQYTSGKSSPQREQQRKLRKQQPRSWQSSTESHKPRSFLI